ncbi:DUF2946 family protein [Bradyrhizobium sp.]|uniref:DUF2946 family protein n=1 Tax=Bradyrhizobium sp. TaxID=376 RepID=UPI001DFE5955|nr:DUF2946 family protein [Bradyrhizobium sp.]MBI5318011.1 DUF2946 family protein [Bradyrhizobium sp.]
MKWFRRHIKTGSRLALFALALQFVLSFGHFHFDAAQAAAAIQGQADLAHAQAPAPDAASQAQRQPSGHDDGQPANEPCAICAVISMANQMLVAAPAVLPLPDAAEQAFLLAGAEFALPGTPRPAFQPRAPPVS